MYSSEFIIEIFLDNKITDLVCYLIFVGFTTTNISYFIYISSQLNIPIKMEDFFDAERKIPHGNKWLFLH